MPIVNTELNCGSALQIIEQSLFDFYLGGSRRAAQLASSRSANINFMLLPNTDYDFYATYDTDIIDFLRINGFKPTEYSYKCLQRNGSYRLDSEVVAILERDDVQVVLRKDAKFYYTVFENIPSDFYFMFLWKSAPHQPDRSQIQPIFEALFSVAHASNNCIPHRVINKVVF